MRITGIAPTRPVALTDSQTVQRQLRSYLRNLGKTTGQRFAVVRDPSTQRFVVQILEADTRTVLDQFPAESILKQLPRKA